MPKPAEIPGRVYTPPEAADWMWQLALRYLDTSPQALRVLEPSAGLGALIEPVQRWAEAGRRQVEVVALELDPRAAAALEARAWAPLTVEVAQVDTLALLARPATTGQRRLPVGPREASLTVPSLHVTPTDAALAAIPQLGTGGFDVVLANPPYLRETGHARLFRGLRRASPRFAALYRKDTDLHLYFWLAAYRWLKPGGIAVFLTPAYYLESASAEPFRQLLTEHGHVRAVWRAGATALFRGIGVEAAVTVWQKRSDTTRPAPTEVLRYLDLPQDGSPWWVRPVTNPDALKALEALKGTVNDCFRVEEGVSTGANRLRAKDAHLVDGGRSGEGIFLLTPDEAEALGEDARTWVHRRLRFDETVQHVLLVRDGDFPRLDDVPLDGAPPEAMNPVEAHLWRFRHVLAARAEIRRNHARSWYAVAWPRHTAHRGPIIATPKWTRRALFRIHDDDAVAMTDVRMLVPRTPQVAAHLEALCDWLNSRELAPWYQARMKRKGAMIEFYGKALARIPIPDPLYSACTSTTS